VEDQAGGLGVVKTPRPLNYLKFVCLRYYRMID
jgi:hypothetical protein